MSSRLSKIHSVHTYVMPRTVYFGWICTWVFCSNLDYCYFDAICRIVMLLIYACKFSHYDGNLLPLMSRLTHCVHIYIGYFHRKLVALREQKHCIWILFCTRKNCLEPPKRKFVKKWNFSSLSFAGASLWFFVLPPFLEGLTLYITNFCESFNGLHSGKYGPVLKNIEYLS